MLNNSMDIMKITRMNLMIIKPISDHNKIEGIRIQRIDNKIDKKKKELK